ncbi:hypothetical protein P4131_17560 [Pseudomonas aeruginosa]|nr:hypothetical protein [Pseudomonas aeruginosa]
MIDKGRKADLESAGGKGKRHGDSAVSLVMAVRASYMAGRKQPIECQTAGRRASAQQDLAGTRNTTNRGWGTVAAAAPTSRLLMHPPKLGQRSPPRATAAILPVHSSGLQQPSDYILQRRGGNDLRIYEEVLRDAQVKADLGPAAAGRRQQGVAGRCRRRPPDRQGRS